MDINFNNLVMRKARTDEIGKVLEFYDNCDYKGGAREDDIILIAEENDELIGVVRLCMEYNVLVLRGMHVKGNFRGFHLGKLLLLFSTGFMGSNHCYCIPYSHLEDFYNTVGFNKIREDEAPPHLQKRVIEYRKDIPDMLIMKRTAEEE